VQKFFMCSTPPRTKNGNAGSDVSLYQKFSMVVSIVPTVPTACYLFKGRARVRSRTNSGSDSA